MKTRLYISPSFTKNVNELEIVFKRSLNNPRSSHVVDNDSISVEAEATDSPGVVVKVSESLTTEARRLSFIFSEPSIRS